MKLENQVTSLEISKRLKELGVKQKSYFRWQVWNDPQNGKKRKEIIRAGEYNFGEVFSAFTVAELGEFLPKEIKKITKYQNENQLEDFYLSFDFDDSRKSDQKQVKYTYYYCGDSMAFFSEIADTEADARGKMMIYLLENKLINI